MKSEASSERDSESSDVALGGSPLQQGQRLNRGPWLHRWLVRFFAGLMGVLVYWLLGFVVSDIGTMRGPSYPEFEERMLDAELVTRVEQLGEEIEESARVETSLKQLQEIARDGASGSQRTMNQLIDLQRLSLERDAKWSDEERQALAESQKGFLQNQRRYHELTEQIAGLSNQREVLRKEARVVQGQLDQARIPIRGSYAAAHQAHRTRVAGLKLAFLLPVLAFAVILFQRLRGGAYVTIAYSIGVALLIKIFEVMNDYFPEDYFKYILIGSSLFVVTKILTRLLRTVAFPKTDYLICQYRDAYESFLCPVCDFPIRRGPLRYMSWTRRSLRRLQPSGVSISSESDEAYTCPCCSTGLYETCAECGGVRHSLLPACHLCGSTEQITEM